MKWVVLFIIVLTAVPVYAADTMTASNNPCQITEPGSTCITYISWSFDGNPWDRQMGIWVKDSANKWNDDPFASYELQKNDEPTAGKYGTGWTTIASKELVAFQGCYAGFNPYKREDCDSVITSVSISAECAAPLVQEGNSCVCPEGTNWDGSTCTACEGGIWDGTQCVACPSECALGTTECTDGQQRTCISNPICGEQWSLPVTCPDGCEGDVCAGEPVSSGVINQFDGNNYRALYATTLMQLAGEEYVIECGGADVINTQAELTKLIEGTEPAVCALQDDNQFLGVMFARNAEGTTVKEVIEHLIRYNNPQISDSDIISEENIHLDACDSLSTVTNDDQIAWFECPDAVTGLPYDIRMYVQPNNPYSYFLTYEFSPDFKKGVWDTITNFFKELFGSQPTSTEPLASFTRGYFAHLTTGGERTVNAVYHADSPGADGKATIIYQNFAFDIGQLAADASYTLGNDYRQVLEFDTITPRQWKQLTAALRITPNNNPPVGVQNTCGNGKLEYGEECEPTTQGFISTASTCADLSLGEGNLACNSDCTLDTSACVSCEDIDNDGFSSAQGQPSALRAVYPNPLLGSLTIGMYDAEDPSYTGARAARAEAGVEAQAIPLPLAAFPEIDSLIINHANDRLPALKGCLLSKTEYECYAEATADVSQISAQLTTGFTNELSPTALCSTKYCTPLETGTLGYFGKTYAAFFSAAANEGIRPIIILDAGRFADHDFGTPPTNQVFENRLKTALTCAAIERATPTADYIYLPGPRGDPEQYLIGYHACRAGMKSTLYYNGRRAEDYSFLADKAEPRLVDGFVTDDPEEFVTHDAVPATLRRTIGAKLLVGADPQGTINALRASPEIILYGYTISPTEFSLAKEILTSLDKPYAPVASAPAKVIIDHGIQTDVYVRSDYTPSALPFDFSSCTGTIQKEDAGQFVETDLTFDDFTTGAPTGTYLFTVSDWSCFLEDTTMTACGEQQDCNDQDATINPGAQEICGDGIDNNCVAGDEDSCSSLPTGDACNYDQVCGSNEDAFSCTDCTGACPAPKTVAFTQGDYVFSISIDAEGKPTIHYANSPGSTCPSINGQMAFNPSPAIDYTTGEILYDTKVLFTQGATAELEATSQGWNLMYTAGTTAANTCWGHAMTGVLKEIEPLDYASCQYQGCSASEPCSSNHMCIDINNQGLISTCYPFDLAYIEECTSPGYFSAFICP